MKLSLVNRGPISAVAARNCLLVNQFATPGLGSLMGRRWIAGTGQLILAILGFALVVFWFFEIMAQSYGQISGDVAVKPVGWMGGIGAILFVASWFWALVTSLSLLAQAKKDETPASTSPPKL
jgi:hypothetical protein